jgi:CheY-like chemotaxis protein
MKESEITHPGDPTVADAQLPNRILMVDDEAPNRRLLRRYIDRTTPGSEFLESEAPDQAINTHLATTRGRGLGLIATDYRMPGGTFGDAFAKLMRGQEVEGRRLSSDIVANLDSVPIVMLTGDVTLEAYFRQLVSERVLDLLILKPFEEDEIRDMLRRQVEGTLRRA